MRMTHRPLLLVITLLGFAASGSAIGAEQYTVDPAHTFVSFRIHHLGFSILQARFDKVSGDMTYDAEDPGKSSIRVQVETASIDTNHEKRDEHLRSAEFLDVQKYPEATFVSTKFEPHGDTGVLTGNLTLHGVTRPVTVETRFIGAGKDPWGGYRRGYTGTMHLKRSDFGMHHNLGPLGDEVELVLTVEGIRK